MNTLLLWPLLLLPGAIGHAWDRDAAGVQTAEIRGRVTGTGGTPIAGVAVTAAPPDPPRTPMLMTTTNRLGEYALQVPAGVFVVEATPLDRVPALAGYATTFFPGVTDREQASILRVDPGARIPVDITLQRQGVWVSGRVLDHGAAAADAAVTLVSSPAKLIRRVRTNSDGTFVIGGLPEGGYVVSTRAAALGRQDVAFQFLNLNLAADSAEVTLTLAPGGTISGNVTVEGGDTALLDGARVVAALLVDGHEVDATAPDQVEIAQDGSFVLDGLFGERAIRVIGLPAGWTVETQKVAVSPASVVEGVTIAARRQ